MDAIFLKSKQGFPVKTENATFSPIECVGGWHFANDESKLNIVKSLSLDYEIKDFSEIEFPLITELCVRCETSYSEGSITNDDGLCKFCETSENQSTDVLTRNSRIDYLIASSKDTLIENHVTELLDRYSIEVNRYRKSGSSELNDKIISETDPYFVSLLNIEILPGFTVKQSILKRINI